jgi:hypothetical protein
LRNKAKRNNKIYRLFLWALLIASLFVLANLAPILTKPQNFSTDDFFPYWAAGKLNLAGENPYDQQNKEKLQIAVSGHGSTTYPISIMLNPPWAVTMVMPFGEISYPLSRLTWLIVSIGCIVYSAQLYWRLYNGPTQQRWIAWIVVLLFAPMISVLEVGQSSTLILLGISLFLYFTVFRQNDWVAGASLVLVAIKPQVIYLFLIAVLFWVFHNHRWKILISAIITALLLTLIAMVFNPLIIQQYLSMVQTGYLSELATPTLGAYIRFFWLGTDKFWLQFIAPFFGGLWFLWLWCKHRKSWSWLDELPILLLVSQVSAPYTYTYDQIILLPAIIQATIWVVHDWKRWTTLIFVVIFLIINVLDLVLHMRLSDFWFIWMAPSLLVWYLLIHWQYSIPREKVQVPVSI